MCVPISKLSECIEKTQNDLTKYDLFGHIVGHVGDGNFHVQLMVDPKNDIEINNLNKFLDDLSKRAILLDGTCTGEHGIGQGKKQYLVEELGSSVDFMKNIKKALDPFNIMNPGKIF